MIRAAILALALAFALACNAQTTDERKKLAFDTIDRNAAELATIGDSIYYFAELGMQEHESAKFLKETLEGIGFRVRTGDAGFRLVDDRVVLCPAACAVVEADPGATLTVLTGCDPMLY